MTGFIYCEIFRSLCIPRKRCSYTREEKLLAKVEAIVNCYQLLGTEAEHTANALSLAMVFKTVQASHSTRTNGEDGEH